MTYAAGDSSNNSYHRWHLDYTDDVTNVSTIPQPSRSQAARATVDAYFHPPGFPEWMSARDPTPFYRITKASTMNNSSSAPQRPQNSRRDAYRLSWKVAFMPARTLFTSLLVVFLVSSARVQIFSLFTISTIVFMHIRSFFAIGEAFRPVFNAYPLTWSNVAIQVVVHVFLCAVGVSIGLYKAHGLGILPTTESDWIALLPLRTIAPMSFRHAPSLH